MPTVGVYRDELFERLGQTFEDAAFDELCFEFGIELDDVLTEDAARELRTGAPTSAAAGSAAAAGAAPRVLYYIAVPANRYDLLCIEGLARALNIFLERAPVPVYRTVAPAPGAGVTVTVKAATFPLRPFIACAVLRGVTFTPARYASFIDLQDKLHQNICRRRTLVAVGTHDLATLAPPFVYDARAPGDIEFVPLSQTRPFRGDALVEFYRTDPSAKHIKPYVDIIAGSPVYPVITDARGTVLSLPPLINGEHSKITLATRDVFVECTARDLAKAHTVLNTLCTMFAEYAAEPFAVETVDVVYEQPVDAFVGGAAAGAPLASTRIERQTTPDLSSRVATASPAAVASLIGVPIDAQRAATLLSKMGLTAQAVSGAARAAAVAEAAGGITASALPRPRGGGAAAAAGGVGEEEFLLRVTVPPTRSDVLHEVDIIEDVAIAYGFNNVPRRLPAVDAGGGAQLPINALTDMLRAECACMGYRECLTLALCATAENYSAMGLPEDGLAVVLSNPQSEDFQIGRTRLVPGLLKSLAHNRAVSVRDGLRLFEVSDVMLLDPTSDVGARNERHLAALYTGPTAGFEVIHGLVDRVMALLEIPPKRFAWEGPAAQQLYSKRGQRYAVEPTDGCATYFPGRGACVVLEDEAGQRTVVGTLGVLHPNVLQAFDLVYPCSAVELTIQDL